MSLIDEMISEKKLRVLGSSGSSKTRMDGDEYDQPILVRYLCNVDHIVLIVAYRKDE